MKKRLTSILMAAFIAVSSTSMVATNFNETDKNYNSTSEKKSLTVIAYDATNSNTNSESQQFLYQTYGTDDPGRW